MNHHIKEPRIRNNVLHSRFIWNLKGEFLIREGKKELIRQSLLEILNLKKKKEKRKKERQSL